MKIFDDNDEVKQEIKDILLDFGILNRFKTFQEYLIRKNIEFDPNDIDELKKIVEYTVYHSVFFLSHLMYQGMRVSGDWGLSGEQQVKSAFCQCLLGIPASKNVSYKDLLEFDKKIDQNLHELNIHDISSEMVKKNYEAFRFSIFGKYFRLGECEKISRILQFLGSNCWIQGRLINGMHSFIYGEGKSIRIAEYEVVFLLKELMRTPNLVMPIAALVGYHDIFVREESLLGIFYQKWVSLFDDEEYLIQKSKEDHFWNISYAIKQQCLKNYNIKTKAELEKSLKLFIKDMRETIYYHEIGHGITSHYLFPLDNAAIAEGSEQFGESIFSALHEFMADFAPTKGKLKGPIQNIVDVSKKNINRAERMYYMYFSDIWFYDTDDDYMFTYTDLMALILLKYIKPDFHIDFLKLEKDLSYFEKSKVNEKPSLFNRLNDMFMLHTNAIKRICQDATYNLYKDLNFEELKEMRLEYAKQTYPMIRKDGYEFIGPFWNAVFIFISQYSNSGQKLKNYIDQSQEIILKKVMIASCGRTKAEEYEFDHRRYIVARCKELGLMAVK